MDMVKLSEVEPANDMAIASRKFQLASKENSFDKVDMIFMRYIKRIEQEQRENDRLRGELARIREEKDKTFRHADALRRLREKMGL